MSAPFLSIRSLERRLAAGNVEHLTFEAGVNVFVGRPNTGKTKWLQTLDFLLGDTGANPYEQSDEEGLAEKYDAASTTICIGDETFRIERRWREAGAKGKVFLLDGAQRLHHSCCGQALRRCGLPWLRQCHLTRTAKGYCCPGGKIEANPVPAPDHCRTAETRVASSGIGIDRLANPLCRVTSSRPPT